MSSYQPSPFARVWFGLLDAFGSPRRSFYARHFHRFDRDETYRRRWVTAMERAGYRDARSGGRETQFFSNRASRSADAEILYDLPQLRANSRENERDNAIGCGLFHSWNVAMVGTGIQDNASTGDDAKDEAIDEVWEELRAALFPAEGDGGWFAAQRILAHKLLEDGEAWVKKAKTGSREALWFEIVEADRVSTPLDASQFMQDKRGTVRGGVERDEQARILAYWIARWHPGNIAIPDIALGKLDTIPALSSRDYERVDRRDARHLKLALRPGQSRGVPQHHAVLRDIHDLDLLVEAAIKRYQISACLAAFVESPEQIPDVLNATAQKYGYELDQDIVPGMIYKLAPGEKVTTLEPNLPMGDLETVVRLMASRIGTALGVSWRVVMSDTADANFSGARIDRVEFDASCSVPQTDLIETLAWVRQQALEDALLRGDQRLLDAGVTVADFRRSKVEFIRPRKDWLDPDAEMQAAALGLAIGVLTQREVCASKGKHWRKNLRQRLLEEKVEREMREEMGLEPVQPVEPKVLQGGKQPGQPVGAAAA